MNIAVNKESQGGNIENKYASNNIIVNYLMRQFKDSLISLVRKVEPASIYEIGCGEGHLTRFLSQNGYSITGGDLSGEVIEYARQLTQSEDDSVSNINFQQQSIYDLDSAIHKSELIVCCEVLEHLENPSMALEKLTSIANPYVILSVPREPIWCFLNLCRGKYITKLGNTPGHIQHWGARKFVNFVQKYFDVIEVKNPLPWTMLLARVKNGHNTN